MRLLLPLVMIVLILGCVQQPIQLEGVEVREYEGQLLSSVNDFRENSILGPQYVNVDNYMLVVSGLVNNPKSYAYDEVLSHQTYSKVITLYCVEGWSVRILWEGVLVRDLLKESGIKEGANTVIFRAVDGYSTSFPLDYVMNNDIIMAYKMNDVTLPPERGFPFQLVAEDKWGYKWIKWISMIEVSDDESYEGFWEQRGFSNTGNINESMFE